MAVRTAYMDTALARGITPKNGAVVHEDNRRPVTRSGNGRTKPGHAAPDDAEINIMYDPLEISHL